MPWRIRRLSEHEDHLLETGVVIEEPLEIRLNGQPVAVLMRTPGLEKELAAGFCMSEGLVASFSDIALVRHCGQVGSDDIPGDDVEGDALDRSRNRVDVTLVPGATALVEKGAAVQWVLSGCGRTQLRDLALGLTPVDAKVTVSAETLSHLQGQMTRQQASYRAAGGIHAAAAFDASGKAMVVCEDIGRHNALDKVIGYCLLRGIPLRDKFLVSTGRASYDMVAKGVRLGVPIVASLSSPTSLAVELADALNCTLVGYLRGKTLNVYTHGWRILTS